MDLPYSDWGDFSCRRAVDSSSFKYVLTDQTLFKNVIQGLIYHCTKSSPYIVIDEVISEILLIA